jgi:hypothetical protein
VPTEKGGLIAVVRQKQSRLTKRHGSELIEFAKAYGINRGAMLENSRRRREALQGAGFVWCVAAVLVLLGEALIELVEDDRR